MMVDDIYLYIYLSIYSHISTVLFPNVRLHDPIRFFILFSRSLRMCETITIRNTITITITIFLFFFLTNFTFAPLV